MQTVLESGVIIRMNAEIKHYSNEAEQSVLGALLLDNELFDEVAGLEEDHFYFDTHKAIYRVLHNLYDSDKPADPVTVDSLLDFDAVKYMMEICETAIGLMNVSQYKDIIIERYYDRTERAIALDIAHGDLSSQDQIEELIALNEKRNSDSIQNTTDANGLAKLFAKDIDTRNNLEPGELLGIRTGFKDLDAHLFGMEDGKMTVVGARPSMGKTAFCLAVAKYVAQDQGVLYLNFEMNFPCSIKILRQ